MCKTRFLLTAGLMLFACQAMARLDIYEMQRLIESGQAEAAYQLALPYRNGYEGFVLFDFYYGWAAIDSGHLDEGVFALSRVVMQQPGNGRARLELARGFYLSGENARARQEFETVLGQAPPTGVRSNVQRFLDAIAVRESTYLPSGDAYAQVSLGYDSNINSAPADDPYAFLFGEKTDWASERGSAFSQVEAGGQYNLPVTRQSAWFVRADGSWRSHQDGAQFNNGTLTAQGGYKHETEKHQYRLAAIAQQYLVDGDGFRDLLGLTGEWNHMPQPTLRYGTNLTWAQLRFPDHPHRDGTLLSGGVNLVGTVRRGLWFAGLFAGREAADDGSEWTDASVSRVFGGARAGWQWPLPRESSATLSALLQWSRYEGEWPWLTGQDLTRPGLETERREDAYTAFELQLRHKLGRRLSVAGALNVAENTSSVADFDYARRQVQVGLRYER